MDITTHITDHTFANDSIWGFPTQITVVPPTHQAPSHIHRPFSLYLNLDLQNSLKVLIGKGAPITSGVGHPALPSIWGSLVKPANTDPPLLALTSRARSQSADARCLRSSGIISQVLWQPSLRHFRATHCWSVLRPSPPAPLFLN